MTTIVKASCHCGLNAFNIEFSTASLPISNDLCHCDSCRHSTGQLFVNYVPFNGVPISQATNQPDDLKHLTLYKTWAANRYFCSTCSAHILWESAGPREGGGWCVAAACLEKVEGIARGTYHIWISDTLDGGIARYLRVIGGIELPRYAKDEADKETLPVGWRADIKKEGRDQDRLAAYCQCKTISFSVTRPSAQSALASAGDKKWWLRPVGSENPTHYLAGHCVCTSCRLTSGSEIQSWVFMPRANIVLHSDSSPATDTELNLQDNDLRPKGLKRYVSSTGRNREFCGTCGATVFWWPEGRHDLLDIAAGLFDQSQDGALAEDWFEWFKEKVTFSQDAVSKTLVQALEEGLRSSQD